MAVLKGKRLTDPQFTPPDSRGAKWSNSRLRVVYRGRLGASPPGREAPCRLGQLRRPPRRPADLRIPGSQPGAGPSSRFDPRPADSSQDRRIPRSGPRSGPQPGNCSPPQESADSCSEPTFSPNSHFSTPGAVPPSKPLKPSKLTQN